MITKEEFMQRLQKACDFNRPVDEAGIQSSLLKFAGKIISVPVKIVFLRNSQELRENGKAARAAWAARAARDAWAAWDARDARAARAARAAWAAWAAWAARDARDAWDAWAAWAAAWDVSYMSCAIAGAIALEDGGFVDKWLPLFEALEAGAWQIWFTTDTIFVATLPSIRRTAPKRLHCSDGPAFSWCDMELYYLNGVLMEPWMVMTKPSEIEAPKVLAVTNVDQRRELIRRIGIDKFIDLLPHKILDRQSDYTLYAVDLTDDLKSVRYLRMLNPSVKEWHVEAVAKDCDTVQQANNWRAYGDKNHLWQPAQLS